MCRIITNKHLGELNVIYYYDVNNSLVFQNGIENLEYINISNLI